MKKILFLICVSFMLFSCSNDEPQIKNPDFCAVTFVEDIILNNNLHVESAIYCETGFSCYITDYDNEYLTDYNFNHANLLNTYDNLIPVYHFGETEPSYTNDNDVLRFWKKMNELFGIVLEYDGFWDYCTSCGETHGNNIQHRNLYGFDLDLIKYHKFYQNVKGDDVRITTMPIHDKGFVHITVNCHHGKHPNPRIYPFIQY